MAAASAERGEGSLRADRSSKSLPYFKFPNRVAHDRRLPAEALAILALRCTFAGKWAFNENDCARGVTLSNGMRGIKIGRKPFYRYMKLLKESGYLSRWQPPSQGKSSFSYASDKLNLPDVKNAYRHVNQVWYDGRLTLKQIATLIFVRAHNRGVFDNEVGKRFGWSKKLARRILGELVASNLLAVDRHHREDGRLGETVFYCAQRRRHQSPGSKNSISPGSRFRAGETRANEKGGDTHIRSYSHTDRSHKPRMTCSARSAALPGPGGRAVESYVSEDDFNDALSDPAALLLEDAKTLSFSTFDISIESEEVQALARIWTVNEHLQNLRRSTGGRINPGLLSPLGAASVILLAAVIMQSDNEITPSQAIRMVYEEIVRLIGQRGNWLSSMKVIGLRIFGRAYDEDFDVETCKRITSEQFSHSLRRRDSGKILHERLYGDINGARQVCKQLGIAPFTLINWVNQLEWLEPMSISTWEELAEKIIYEASK